MAHGIDPTMEELLRRVIEPAIGIDVITLGMVTSASMERGSCEVLFNTYLDPYPYQEQLATHVKAALASGLGGGVVRIGFARSSKSQLEVMEQAMLVSLSPGERSNVLARKAAFNTSESKCRVVGISSGKGGVGKSSVTANLAVSLGRLGMRVGVLDADVYGYSIPRMLGVTLQPALIGRFMVPPLAHDVSCISVGFFLTDDTPVVWRGPMLHKAIEQFLVDVFWGPLDFLLIDMPPGTGDVALSLGEFLPKSEVIVVTTPQEAAAKVAQRSAMAARKLKLPVRGVVENMAFFRGDDGRAYEIFGSGGGSRLATTLGVPLLGSIPIEPRLRIGGDSGVPIAISEPESESSLAFSEVAERLVGLGPSRRYRSELKIG